MSSGTIFVLFFVLLALAIPISTTLGIVSIVPSLYNSSFPANAQYIIRAMFAGMDSFPLLAIPMFVLSGILMARGGVSKKLFNIFSYFIGDKTAGMPCAVIITCLFYGAISGSAPATVAAVGSMTIPILINLGYDKAFTTALVAVAGGLGVIIPPSIPFILYGMSTGTSVGELFIAGVIPGLLIGFLLMIYAYYYCKKNGEDKEKINASVKELRDKGFLTVLMDSSWALLTPVIILGSIYSGIASPTEAAVLSVIYALFISLFVYKTLKIKELWNIFIEAVRTFTPLLFIISAAIAFSRVLTLLQVPQTVASVITSTFSEKVAILLVINAFLLFVGMVMDTTPAILILSPMFMPIIQTIDVNPIHFGVIMVVNLAIGFVTPPVGVNLFVASSLTGVPVLSISKKAIPLTIMFLIALLCITFIPEISMILVS
ncbi:TRAP transporter large permease [Sedimentibacter sp.]|uniref:TRAP transporter large permease n=1 Tax=Sedimentibacter sp. TaxID=1960295 RepID=UPI0028A6C950|nr:TRAP transporter large permease [Sedimentibacter sp.]